MIITHLSFIDCHNWPSSEGRKPIVQQNIPHLYHNIWITSIRQTWILKKDGTSSLATNSTLQIRSLGARVSITSLNSPGDNCEEKAKMKISLLKYFACLVWRQGVDPIQLTDCQWQSLISCWAMAVKAVITNTVEPIIEQDLNIMKRVLVTWVRFPKPILKSKSKRVLKLT